MDREFDAKVVESVFGYRLTCPVDNTCEHAVGFKRDGSSARRNFCAIDGKEYVIPLYADSAAADYEVLKHVRETWKRFEKSVFHASLETAWIMRGFDEFPAEAYQPGDYARAALAVLDD